MDSIALVARWMAQHPFAVLGALVTLAAAIKLVWRLRAGFRSSKARALLRTVQEQKRFEPVQTVYNPKGYRKPRP